MKHLRTGLFAASVALLVSLVPAAPAAAGSGWHDDHGESGTSQTMNRFDGGGDRGDRDRGDRDRGDRDRGDRDRGDQGHGGRDGWHGGDRWEDRDHGRHGGHRGHHSEQVQSCKELHERLVRAETGVGFGSVGECIQHVALGGTLSYLDIDTSVRYDCPAGGTCWGIVIGSGLQAESEVQTSWMTPTGQAFADFIADNRGEINEELNFACGAPGAVSQVRALGATSGGLSIQVVPPVDAPC